MAIADVIRQYRNERGLTQEEMARCLGVSAPAVNKWEKGNTLPDVALLAPIARLLGITTDELLSFHQELTKEEVDQFLLQVKTDLETKPFDEVFSAVKQKIEAYPNCESLIWQAAMILHANRQVTKPAKAKEYDAVIFGWFERCLRSEDEKIRIMGAEALFYAYFAQEDYEKASRCLNYYSTEDPERKRKDAILKSKTGKREEAYRAYEELLFSGYQSLQFALNDLRLMYMEEEDHDLANLLVDVSSKLAAAFQMGRYHEVSVGLDVAVWEKDPERTVEIVREILESTNTLSDFTGSPLYQHLPLKQVSDDSAGQLLEQELLGIFDEESFAFLDGNESWEMLKRQKRKIDSKTT